MTEQQRLLCQQTEPELPHVDPATPDHRLEPGMFISFYAYKELEILHGKLLNTIGILRPIFELMKSSEPEVQKRCIKLAEETSARGALAMKQLLWKWHGLRNLADEESEISKESLTP